MYLRLLKVFFKQQFSFQRLFGQNVAQSWWKRWLFVGLLIYAMAVSIGGNLYLYTEIANDLLTLNQIHLLLPILFTNVVSVAIFLTLFQATGYLFAYKDFELLAPLPIPHWQVIAAKITMMHAFVILFSILLNGPILGVYLVYAQANIFMIVLSLVFYLFIPIPVMLIVSLLSWLIHQWSSRFVNKNIMQIVFMIMFLLGYLTISLGSFSEDLVAVFDPFIQLINAFYEPALWFQQGVATLDFLSIVLFLAFHGLAYGVFILVMNPLSRVSNLDQLSARQSSQATSNTRYRKQSFFWSMFHKEWRYYFSIPIYFINTAFGLLLMLGGSIGLALFRNDVLMLLEFPDLPIEWVVLIFFGLSISTVYTPAISLSLEGSNFSVLKSLPINGKTVMLSKVVFNIVLILIPFLMAWFILSMNNIMSLISLSFIGFNAVLFTVLMSLINGLINMAFPKFEFQNEVEVVKQSLGALLGVFSGFGVMVLFALFLSVFVVLDFVFMMIALSLIQILFVVFLLWVYERFVHGWFQTL